MVYPPLLPLMRTPRLPVVDWTDAPADLNGLVRFAERRNLVSARVPSHFKRSLLPSILPPLSFHCHFISATIKCCYSGWLLFYSFVSLELCNLIPRQSESTCQQSLDWPWKSQEDEDPRFRDNRQVHVVRLSALVTGRLYPQKIFLILIFVRSLVDFRSIILMSIENCIGIGNRTRDLPACSAVHQPNAPPRASM
jgi:hypothetical protein